jgi:2',3'-cyclic-nucleotide 2'-phosphodiesterase/3'-nucleotidase
MTATCTLVIQAMNAVASTPRRWANYEFNYGLEFLTKALAGADFR